MKIYFACASKKIDRHIGEYQSIRELIISSGNKINGDWIGRIIKQKQNKNYKFAIPSIKKEGLKAIDDSDILIAEVSIPSVSVGYQIYYALSKKIPVLCLYSLEFGNKKPPQIIHAIDSVLLVTTSYTNKNISSVINNFLENIPTENLIKFNFIVTPEIEEFINSGARKNKMSKSAFLRKKVENIINSQKTES